jgi:hypothetical protein
MSVAATPARDARSLVLSGLPAQLPATQRAWPSQAGVWRRTSFWASEFLWLVAAVYMLPLVILAIGIPVGLVLTALLLSAGWVWSTLW